MKILIAFYSMYGHIFDLSQSIEEGAKSVPGITVDMRRIPETLSMDLLKKSGAYNSWQQMKQIPECSVSDLPNYSAIIFGTPTRYGNMCSQMRSFLDQTEGLWKKNALVGKVGSVFTSSGTQAKRARINDLKFSYYAFAFRNGHRRPTLFLFGTDYN